MKKPLKDFFFRQFDRNMKQLTNFFTAKVTFVLLVALLMMACNQQKEAPPFPINENRYEQPEIRPLKFPESQEFTWVELNERDIQLSSKTKFNLYKLPSKAFDIGAPYPYMDSIVKSEFDWSKLPSSEFDLNSLPTQKLEPVTKVLGAPTIVKAGYPVTLAGASRGVMNIDSNFGLPGLCKVTMLDSNGLIWFGTSNGIARYDGENLEIYGSDQGLDGVNVYELFEDSQGRIWVHSNNETVSVIDFDANLIHEMINSFNTNFRTTMIEAKDGTFWYGNLRKGYLILDFEAKTLKSFNTEQGLLGNFNVTAFQDREGLIWLSTSNGANIIDLNAGKNYALTKEGGLMDNFVSSFLQDDSGDIWISGGRGVSILNKDKSAVSYIKADKGLFGSSGCSDIFKDSNGIYWLGTNNGLLFSFDKTKGLIKKFVLRGVRNNWVYHIFEDKQGEIWSSIAQDGLFKIDMSLGMPANFDMNDGLSSNDMWATLEDVNGNIWIGSRDGIDIYDPEENKIRQLTEAQGLFDNSNTRLDTDSRGRIWTSGRTEGLSIIDPEEQTIQKLSTADNVLQGVIVSSVEIAEGRYWLGSDEGEILSVDLKKKAFKSIRLDTADNNVGNNEMLRDVKGRVWVATLDTGIEEYDLENNTYSRLGTGTGLISDRVYSVFNGNYWIFF